MAVIQRVGSPAKPRKWMSGNTTKVKNIKKYLLAALFNAPSTMNGYYQAEVNHDMPGLVR